MLLNSSSCPVLCLNSLPLKRRRPEDFWKASGPTSIIGWSCLKLPFMLGYFLIKNAQMVEELLAVRYRHISGSKALDNLKKRQPDQGHTKKRPRVNSTAHPPSNVANPSKLCLHYCKNHSNQLCYKLNNVYYKCRSIQYFVKECP